MIIKTIWQALYELDEATGDLERAKNTSAWQCSECGFLISTEKITDLDRWTGCPSCQKKYHDTGLDRETIENVFRD